MKIRWFPVILGVLTGGYLIIAAVTLPPRVARAKLVTIPDNATAARIARTLQKEGVIRNESWFLFLTNRGSLQHKLQAGTYEFYGRTALRDVIKKLLRGQVVLVRVTIPEGSTRVEIAGILEESGLAAYEKFPRFCPVEECEGYLFPDTYFFPMNVSPHTVRNTMVNRFYEEYRDLYGSLPQTPDEKEKMRRTVTIASIIEKEAVYDFERPVVASVIRNRLKRSLPLQSCATVEYALGRHRARLYEKDLEIRSPYNTYLHPGLPPTPICNPGRASLRAALQPADTEFLYFVSRGDGTLHFSRTYAEHLWARRKDLDNEDVQPHEEIRPETTQRPPRSLK